MGKGGGEPLAWWLPASTSVTNCFMKDESSSLVKSGERSRSCMLLPDHKLIQTGGDGIGQAKKHRESKGAAKASNDFNLLEKSLIGPACEDTIDTLAPSRSRGTRASQVAIVPK